MRVEKVKITRYFPFSREPIIYEYLNDEIKNIPDIPENKHIFDVLSISSKKDVQESISKHKNLSKKAKIILGFMEKFTYYDSTHN